MQYHTRRPQRQRWSSQLHFALYGCLLMVALLLAACQSDEETPTPAPEAEEVAEINAVNEEIAQSGNVTEIEPYPPDQTTGPVRLQIPEINLDVPVIAMGWRVEMDNGERATVWDVPLDEAGWHINSAGAGALGNTVISGRQVGGSAVFAPLALGSIARGQEVLLTDGDGITFVYRISDVTDPIPVTGATPDETARASAYFAPTENAQLTLVTGWPEFTTTHSVFATADFVGVLR
jgi:sortase (surface protein transpeptidase)